MMKLYEEDKECNHETCEWQNVGICGYCDEHCDCEGLQDVWFYKIFSILLGYIQRGSQKLSNILFTSSYLGFGAMFFGLGWVTLSIVSSVPLGVITVVGAVITAVGTAVVINALSKLEKIEVTEND